MEFKNPSKLCLKCGLCCVMLHARISEKELERVSSEHKIPKDKFVLHVDNEIRIKMPCRFLVGNPGSWVTCQIYRGYRPSVCHTYLCRPAVQYKLGVLSLKEAHEIILRAQRENNVSLFNWGCNTNDELLQKMAYRDHIRKEAKQLANGDLKEEDAENILLSEIFTPQYQLVEPLKLRMIFNFLDENRLKPEDVLGRMELAEDQKKVFFTTIRKIRGLFIRKEKNNE